MAFAHWSVSGLIARIRVLQSAPHLCGADRAILANMLAELARR